MIAHIIKTEIDLEDESPNISNPQYLHNCSLKKELRIILARCDEKKNYYKLPPTRSQKTVCSVDGCGKSFSTKWNFRKHFRNAHESSSIKCPYENCGKFLKPSYIGIHTLMLHKNGKYPCPIDSCNAAFITKSRLWLHQEFIHSGVRHSCENCGAEVMHLRAHMSMCLNNGKKNFHCPVEGCNSSFTRVDSLGRHKKIVHEKITRKSDNCRKMYSHKKSHESLIIAEKCTRLNTHRVSCLGDGVKRFFCTVKNCHKSFANAKALDNHVKRVHSDPVKCSYEDCTIYAKPYLMKHHVRFYHEHREMYRCNNCGKTYCDLIQHRQICTSDGVKRFSCEVENCGASFITKRYLYYHVRSTHGERVKCPHKNCDAFVKPASMVQHLKIVHEGMKRKQGIH